MKIEIIDGKKGMSILPHIFADRLYSKFGKRRFFINDTQWSMGTFEKENNG